MYLIRTIIHCHAHKENLLITCFFLLALVLPGCAPASAQHAQEIISSFAEENYFDGVILIAKGDSVLNGQAYGHANFEGDIPTNVDTRYQLGSISKWITSIVILKLADQGTLSLEAPIGRYLPTYRDDAGRRVTLHHLLTHTSGIPNDFVHAFENDPSILEEPLTLGEAVNRFASGDLLFEPGSQYDYSHSNWILVKYIVEQATGQSFAENLQTLLTVPLALADTGVFTGAFSDVPGSAVGYTEKEPVPERFAMSLPAYAACAGGLYSTASDLLSLLHGLFSGNVLSEDMLNRLTTVYVEDEAYAYGGHMNVLELGSRKEKILWLTGSNGPFKSRVSRVLTNGLTVITLTNTGASPEQTGRLTERLLASFYR